MAVLAIPGNIRGLATFAIQANSKNSSRVDTADSLAKRAADGDGKALRQLRCLGGDNDPALRKEFNAGPAGCGFADTNARNYARVLSAWLESHLSVPVSGANIPDNIAAPTGGVTVEPPPVQPPPGTTATQPPTDTTTGTVTAPPPPGQAVTSGSTAGYQQAAPAPTVNPLWIGAGLVAAFLIVRGR